MLNQVNILLDVLGEYATLREARVLLSIPENGAVPFTQLLQTVGLKQGSFSVAMKVLARCPRVPRNRILPPYPLVRTFQDPQDRRHKLVELSEQGKQLIRKLGEVQ